MRFQFLYISNILVDHHDFQVLEKAKVKYEAEKEELTRLIKLRNEMRKEELTEAVIKSNRTYEETLTFIKGGEVE